MLTFSVLLNFVMMVVAFLLYTIAVRFMLERNAFVGPMFKGAMVEMNDHSKIARELFPDADDAMIMRVVYFMSIGWTFSAKFCDAYDDGEKCWGAHWHVEASSKDEHGSTRRRSFYSFMEKRNDSVCDVLKQLNEVAIYDSSTNLGKLRDIIQKKTITNTNSLEVIEEALSCVLTHLENQIRKAPSE